MAKPAVDALGEFILGEAAIPRVAAERSVGCLALTAFDVHRRRTLLERSLQSPIILFVMGQC